MMEFSRRSRHHRRRIFFGVGPQSNTCSASSGKSKALAHPASMKTGVTRESSRNVGWDAVDVMASWRALARPERGCRGRLNRVVLMTRCWCQGCERDLAYRRWQESPAHHRESATYAVNHRAGKAGVIRLSLWLPPHALLFACGPWVSVDARPSLRPLHSRGTCFRHQLGRDPPRDREGVSRCWES